MAIAAKDTNKEAEFLNFLTKYDLQQYHQGFLDIGIKKIHHLSHIKEEDLETIGLTRPERQRLLDKYERHFSKLGKFKDKLLRKGKKYAASLNAAQAIEQAKVDPGAMLIDDGDIRMLDKIGEGAHGIVHEGIWETKNGMQKVAIKVLTDNDDVSFLTEFLKEANVMLKLQHPNIIKMYGVILAPTRLIEEFAVMGDLHSYLMNDKNIFTVKVTHGYAEQIASAMCYLEEKRMLHRDLAVRNILVYSKDMLKLSDFGMARVLDEYSDVYKLSNLASRVPIAWSALEVLTEAKFSGASDVWSYGVTMWEIYSLGAAPWKGLNPVEIRDKLLAGERLSKPKRCHQRMYDLLLLCWTKTPKNRPKFTEIVKLLTEIRYEQMMAVRDCNADGDADLLPFKAGDIMTIIDKNSGEWWTGIHDKDGQFGHFQVNHVSRDLTPLETVKNNLKIKRKSSANVVISSPTNIVHKSHMGSDGTRWSTEPNPTNASSPAPQRHERGNVGIPSPYLVPKKSTDADTKLIELDDEMHNITGGQGHHYDTPRTMSKSTSSPSVQQHPVPKPRHKLPARAATMDNDPPCANKAAIVSQYSHLQSESTDPSALVVSPTHPDDYIAIGHKAHHYQNIDNDQFEYAENWLGGNGRNATGELVIQPNSRADAYAMTSFNPPPVHDHMGSHAATLPARSHHIATTSPPLSSDIRYPPPMISETPLQGILSGQVGNEYDALRLEDQHQHTTLPVTRQYMGRRNSDSPVVVKRKTDHRRGSDTPPTTRRTVGPYDHLIGSLKEKLPQASDAICAQYLNKNKGDMDRTLEDVKVHILMDMGLDNTDADNCRKALSHCQWKLDRAAEWLIEQSIS